MGVQKKTILVFLLLLFLVLAVTAFFSLRGSEAGTAYAGGASAGIITFFLAGIFLVSGAAVLYQRRKKWYGAPEHFYFPAAVCIGCAMIALLPAWNINDFGKHFGAAWHYANRLSGIGSDEDFMLTIREGDTATVRDVFFEEGENFYSPTARSYRNVADGLFAPCESNRNVLYEIDSPRSSGMSFYSAWNYIPFIATFALLRPTGIGMVGLLTLGRICALLLYSSAIFHAIKRMPLPQGKWLMALLAILPVNMMNLTALTYDGVVFAASCLLISSILHLKCLQDAEVGRRDVAELLLSAFLLAAVKGGGYSMLYLLTGMLLSGPFKSRKNIAVMAGAAMTILVILYYDVWKQTGAPAFFQFQVREGFFSARYALRHPWIYLPMWLNTYLMNLDGIFHTAVSGNFGWNENIVPEWVSIGFLLCVIVLTVSMSRIHALSEKAAGRDMTLGKRDRILLLAVVVLAALTIPLTVIYGTPREANVIYSVFGRYFLPVFLPLLLFFFYRPLRLPAEGDTAAVPPGGAAAGFAGLAALYMVTVYFMMTTYLVR